MQILQENLNNLIEKIQDVDGETLKERLIKIFGYTTAIYLIYATSKQILSTIALIRRNKKQYKNLPTPPGNWFFGTLGQFKDREKVPKKVLSWAKNFNGVYYIQLGPTYRRLVIAKPSLAKEIFVTSEPKDPKIYGFVKDWLGDGLLLSSGPKWFRNRRLLTPAFHYDILKPYVEAFNDCAKVLSQKWTKAIEKKEKVEVFHDVSLMTLDSLLKCIFGQDSSCQLSDTKHPYLTAVERITYFVSRRITSLSSSIPILYYLTPESWKYLYYLHVLHSFTRNVIAEKKRDLKNGQNGKKRFKYLDFIDILLSAADEDGKGLTDQEIAAEVDTFMFEGHDTTASGISWCLFNLANNVEIQEKCRREILMIFEEKGSDNVEWDDLQKMTYLSRVIKESLRLNPPVPFISRIITEEKTLKNGLILRVGTAVSLSIFAIQRDPETWSNPDVFDPDRHLVNDSTKGRDPFSFVPFSAGPRNCIGQNFAMNEMKVILAVLLKNFRFSVKKDNMPQMSFQLILKAANGIYLNMEKV